MVKRELTTLEDTMKVRLLDVVEIKFDDDGEELTVMISDYNYAPKGTKPRLNSYEGITRQGKFVENIMPSEIIKKVGRVTF